MLGNDHESVPFQELVEGTTTRSNADRLIQIKVAARLRPRNWRMSFDPRSIFNIEVASIAVILFSIALICYVLLSLAGIIVEFPD